MAGKQTLFHDFDLGWAESHKEPLPVKIYDTVYNIPADIPAIIPLKLLRESEDGTMTPAFVFDVIAAIFGNETLDEWVKKGMTLPQLMDILMFITANYRAEGDDAGNVEAETAATVSA